jgi:Fe2+ or Zn2+ uptake regulation protein
MPTLQQRCDEILHYLQTHPDAGDTAEGIAEWWLTECDAGESKVLVEQALHLLVKQGLLERHIIAEGTVLYELAPPKPPT